MKVPGNEAVHFLVRFGTIAAKALFVRLSSNTAKTAPVTELMGRGEGTQSILQPRGKIFQGGVVDHGPAWQAHAVRGRASVTRTALKSLWLGPNQATDSNFFFQCRYETPHFVIGN